MEWEWILPSPLSLLMRALVRRSATRRNLALMEAARAWPKARGHVYSTQAKQEDRSTEGWLCWQVELTYSYTVGSEFHSGRFLLPPDSEDEANEQAGRWADKDVIVRYRSDEVAQSVFLLEDQS